MNVDDLLTIDGTTQPITEWALDFGIPAKLIAARIGAGMTHRDAVTRLMPHVRGQRLPPEHGRAARRKRMTGRVHLRKLYTAFGDTLSLRAWSDRYSVSVGAIRMRIRNGWPIEEAVSTPVTRGVARDLPGFTGTGGGSVAGEAAHLEFPASVEKAPL